MADFGGLGFVGHVVDGVAEPAVRELVFTDAIVNGRDDLVDFFPVWLDMGQILDSIPEDSQSLPQNPLDALRAFV